jgi:peptidoglycan hydrolase-like protein with peptidoglycan-binding domain
MSKKLWSGLITVFGIFFIFQIISNIRQQAFQDKEPNVPEIVVDMSTLNATILAEEPEPKLTPKLETQPVGQIQAQVDSKFPRDIKQIQLALNAAGFNPGAIDGKLGVKTKAAIKQFQKSHDLQVDGKVGANTWRLLKKYLEN